MLDAATGLELPTQNDILMLSLKRVRAADRRRTAVHEAGHYVMAQHHGCLVFGVRIWPNDHSDLVGETTWLGHCQLNWWQASLKIRRLIAVAGVAAVSIWNRDLCGDDLDWCDPDITSESDWRLAGCTPGEPTKHFLSAVDKAFAMFSPDGELWPKVLSKSRELIVHSRTTQRISIGERFEEFPAER